MQGWIKINSSLTNSTYSHQILLFRFVSVHPCGKLGGLFGPSTVFQTYIHFIGNVGETHENILMGRKDFEKIPEQNREMCVHDTVMTPLNRDMCIHDIVMVSLNRDMCV